MIKRFTADPDKSKWRLDKFLSFQLPGISRSLISSLAKKGLIEVNKQIKKSSYLIKAGDKIKISLPPKDKELQPYDFPIPIIWEDESILVVNKPSGIPVHPHGQNKNKTLVNALLHMGKTLSGPDRNRPGIVHRLDKETSGVMILAKNNLAYQSLISQFKNRTVKKEYRVLAWGKPERNAFEINLPLKRKEKERLKMEIKLSGEKDALTRVKVLQRLEEMVYLAVFPKTGRMHQIRVHLSFQNLPIVGDKKYGKKDGSTYFFLHAYKIQFKHPQSKVFLEFKAPLPAYFVLK